MFRIRKIAIERIRDDVLMRTSAIGFFTAVRVHYGIGLCHQITMRNIEHNKMEKQNYDEGGYNFFTLLSQAPYREIIFKEHSIPI